MVAAAAAPYGGSFTGWRGVEGKGAKSNYQEQSREQRQKCAGMRCQAHGHEERQLEVLQDCLDPGRQGKVVGPDEGEHLHFDDEDGDGVKPVGEHAHGRPSKDDEDEPKGEQLPGRGTAEKRRNMAALQVADTVRP